MEVFAATVSMLGYACVLTASGLVLARLTLSPWPEAIDRQGGKLAISAAAMASLFEILSIGILFWRLGGTFDQAIIGTMVEPPIGPAFAMQLAGCLLMMTSRAKPSIAGIVGALAAISSLAIAGHAYTSAWTTIALVTCHLAGAAWWVGCLWLLHSATAVEHHEGLAVRLAMFSQQALWAIAIVISAGSLAALRLLDFQFNLDARYDATLAIKLLLVTVLLIVAAFNKWVVTPKIPHAPNVARLLRIAIRVEAALIALIVGVTAIFTTYFSPHV